MLQFEGRRTWRPVALSVGAVRQFCGGRGVKVDTCMMTDDSKSMKVIVGFGAECCYS